MNRPLLVKASKEHFMSIMQGRKIGIVGAGRLGTALGKAILLKGYDIVGISVRSRSSAERARRVVPSVPVLDQSDLAKDSDILFLAVADDAIDTVAGSLASSGAIHPGQWVAHLSG